MKATSLLFFLLVVFGINLYSQKDTWDIPVTEVMISHNKKNFSDHQEATANQIVSQSTVSRWKSTTGKFKNLSDFIDKRLTAAFIVMADATTLYNVYSQLSEMVDYEEKALEIAYSRPWLIPVLANEESKIVQSGDDLLNYLALIALSYGDISKMKVSTRKTIFREIDLQVGVLKGRCYSLYQMMKRFELTNEIRKTKGVQYFNKDAEVVKSILKNIK